MHSVTFEEAQQLLPALVEEAIRGGEVVILRGGEPVVKLVPVKSPCRRPQFGSAKGLITMSDDFDAPLDDFAEYMP